MKEQITMFHCHDLLKQGNEFLICCRKLFKTMERILNLWLRFKPMEQISMLP